MQKMQRKRFLCWVFHHFSPVAVVWWATRGKYILQRLSLLVNGKINTLHEKIFWIQNINCNANRVFNQDDFKIIIWAEFRHVIRKTTIFLISFILHADEYPDRSV